MLKSFWKYIRYSRSLLKKKKKKSTLSLVPVCLFVCPYVCLSGNGETTDKKTKHSNKNSTLFGEEGVGKLNEYSDFQKNYLCIFAQKMQNSQYILHTIVSKYENFSK